MKAPARGTILRWTLALAILGGAALAIPHLKPFSERATVVRAVDRAVGELEKGIAFSRPDLVAPVGVALFADSQEAAGALEEVRLRMARSSSLHLSVRGRPIRILKETSEKGAVRLGLAFDEASVEPVDVELVASPVSAYSLLPPLFAIVLAFATGKLVLSLGLAIVGGALLATGFSPVATATRVVWDYGWEATFTDASKLWIFVFTTVLIGTVGLVTYAGGVQGVVSRLSRVAKGPKSTQFVTFFMGLAIFFDDYANTILVGGTMRPLSDRMRISREKLSYLVDSTSAPVAGIALISTWIGYEVGLLGDASQSLGLGLDGYQIFFQSIPFRFYCMFTLVFVFLLILSGRDFGPMLRAERRAATTGAVLRPGARPLGPREAKEGSVRLHGASVKEGVRQLPIVALLPIGLILFGTLLGLLWDGGGLLALGESPLSLFSFEVWRDAFGDADSTKVLGYATLAGAALAFLLVVTLGLLTVREAASAFGRGARSMGIALAILALAWGLKATCDDLGTSELLVAGLRDVLDPRALPILVFVLAGLVAFSTGTSWGTMGILIPTATPLAYHLAGPEGMFLTVAAVLDGAIFGDHASPISDTTVMSSIATGSDHLDHVRTQMPYASVTMGVALFLGYGWNAMGWPYWMAWALGILAIAAVIYGVGKKSRGEEVSTEIGLMGAP